MSDEVTPATITAEVRMFVSYDGEAEVDPVEVPVMVDFENGTAWCYVKASDLRVAHVPLLREVLHDAWLAIHVRRFDADSPHDGRRKEAIDSYYRGITVAEGLVSRIARRCGIPRIYDSIPGYQTDRRLIDGTPEVEDA